MSTSGGSYLSKNFSQLRDLRKGLVVVSIENMLAHTQTHTLLKTKINVEIMMTNQCYIDPGDMEVKKPNKI